MTAPDDLVDALTSALSDRAEILEAYLFGSAATGRAQPHSDVDVAVFVDHERLPASPFGYPAELGAALMAALGRERIDVVVLNDAGPMLYHEVLRDGTRLLSRDVGRTTTREGQALSRWCDWVPQLRKIEAAHSRRIRDGKFGR